LTEGALVNQWHALSGLMEPFYRDIKDTIHNSKGAVHADETGHRQKGKRAWTWVFSTMTEALYVIRMSRGSDVVLEILGDTFKGILVTDFWKPYLAVKARLRQWCIAHFLREFKKIEHKRGRHPPEYLRFHKKVRRMFADALRFSRQKKTTRSDRVQAQKRFLKRLDAIVAGRYSDPEVKRLVKRLKTYRDGFFTFVAEKGVSATNNHAERIIRTAVLMRKVSFHTMSAKGSETMSILMSVFRTLELRGLDSFEETLRMAREEIIRRKSTKSRSAA